MRKVDLQQQAVKLIRQLSTEKLRAAVDYLSYLQDKDARNNLPDQDIPPAGSWNGDPRYFQTFRRGRT